MIREDSSFCYQNCLATLHKKLKIFIFIFLSFDSYFFFKIFLIVIFHLIVSFQLYDIYEILLNVKAIMDRVIKILYFTVFEVEIQNYENYFPYLINHGETCRYLLFKALYRCSVSWILVIRFCLTISKNFAGSYKNIRFTCFVKLVHDFCHLGGEN